MATMAMEKILQLDNLGVYDGTLPPSSGGAHNFAFFAHPLSRANALIIEPRVRRFMDKPGDLFELMLRSGFAKLRLKVTGLATVRAAGRQAHGAFIFVPYLPSDFMDETKRQEILATLLEGSQVAKACGAQYLGMGAFTSIITGNGAWLDRQETNVLPVTSGSAGTAVGVYLAVLKAARRLRLNFQRATLAVVGATGAVGEPSSLRLAKHFGRTLIVARNEGRLAKLQQKLAAIGVRSVEMTTDLNVAISQADVVVLATNATDAQALGLNPQSFRPGTLVVDVSRPHNVSPELIAARPDILCIEGAIFRFKGETDFHIPLQMGGPHHAFGCLSETMALAMAGVVESKSIGPRTDLETVALVEGHLKRYGFRVADFRMFDQPLAEPNFQAVRLARRQHSTKGGLSLLSPGWQSV
jgi:predicted amino acid dehydrogenase